MGQLICSRLSPSCLECHFAPVKNCIFCGARANSEEHFWPEWALKHLPKTTLAGFIGKHKDLKFSGDYTVRCVCRECNQHWMSDIETGNIPLLGRMMLDNSIRLDQPQQLTVASWAVLKAMVLDTTTVSKQRPLFYTQTERDNLRTSSLLPPRTFVWLGRFLGLGRSGRSGGILGNLTRPPGICRGHVTTIVMGSVCIQTLTLHTVPEYSYGTIDIQPTEGPWNALLVSCWPTLPRAEWPPVLAFEESTRPLLGIGGLHERWQRGDEREFV